MGHTSNRVEPFPTGTLAKWWNSRKGPGEEADPCYETSITVVHPSEAQDLLENGSIFGDCGMAVPFPASERFLYHVTLALQSGAYRANDGVRRTYSIARLAPARPLACLGLHVRLIPRATLKCMVGNWIGE